MGDVNIIRIFSFETLELSSGLMDSFSKGYSTCYSCGEFKNRPICFIGLVGLLFELATNRIYQLVSYTLALRVLERRSICQRLFSVECVFILANQEFGLPTWGRFSLWLIW